MFDLKYPDYPECADEARRCIYIPSAGKTSHYRECPPMKETEIIIALSCVFELEACGDRTLQATGHKLNRKKSIRAKKFSIFKPWDNIIRGNCFSLSLADKIRRIDPIKYLLMCKSHIGY